MYVTALTRWNIFYLDGSIREILGFKAILFVDIDLLEMYRVASMYRNDGCGI
jgi:hypothetical protein